MSSMPKGSTSFTNSEMFRLTQVLFSRWITSQSMGFVMFVSSSSSIEQKQSGQGPSRAFSFWTSTLAILADTHISSDFLMMMSLLSFL